MELVVHDVVEQILERLPPKSLMRFKSVSKQWKSTIESPLFQHTHLTHHRQKSKTPDLLMINTDFKTLESIVTLELESSISRNIPIPWENDLFSFCQNSIDGLVCLYNDYDSVAIFNPTTRWYRTFPPPINQQIPNLRLRPFCTLGFGKDKVNGLYKPVWVYNSSELGQTCEVFDFKINAWRLVEPSPKRISVWEDPVYLNGLLYWLTEEKEEIPSVLSFDLHTETFEFVCKAPFSDMIIFNLDDNLCVSNRYDVGHVIWAWNFAEKTWKTIYSMDLYRICTDYENCSMCEVRPLVFVEDKKLILFDYDSCCDVENMQVVLYESHTKLYRRVVSKRECTKTLCYFPSLTSIL